MLSGRLLFTLVKSLVDLRFVCLNSGSSTFCSSINPGSESCIDLSFATSDICLNLEWSISNDTWGSDHLPITIALYSRVFSYTLFKKTLKLYSLKTDWKLFKNIIETLLNSDLCSKEIFLIYYIDLMLL